MSAPASQTQWYLARDGQQYGPLTDAELAKFIELGHLQPTDLLWREGFPDWRPAMVVFRRRQRAGRLRRGPLRPCVPRMRRRSPPLRRASAASTAPKYQGNPGRRRRPSSRAARDHARYAEPDEPEARGGGLKKVLLVVVCLAAAGCGRLVCLSASRRADGDRRRPCRRELTAVVSAMIDRKGAGGGLAQGPRRLAGDDRCAAAGDAAVAHRQAEFPGLVRRAPQGGRGAGRREQGPGRNRPAPGARAGRPAPPERQARARRRRSPAEGGRHDVLREPGAAAESTAARPASR